MARSKRREKYRRAIAPLRVTVKFLTDCDPGNGKPVFKKGSVHELVISSANHWIKRGKALKYVESAKPVKKGGRPKKAEVKPEPIVEEPVSEDPPEEEPATEENKTAAGESSEEMDDLMG